MGIISSIRIKNFRAFKDSSFDFLDRALLIGENDSGKTTILKALDVFFNSDRISKEDVIDQEEDVEISVEFEDSSFVRKVYSPKNFKEKISRDIEILDKYNYVYISPYEQDIKKIIVELAVSLANSLINDDTKKYLDEVFEKSMNDVLSKIDEEILVVNSEETKIIHSHQLTLGNAAKYTIESDGVPIESRGSGYRKNLLYALLTKGTYINTVFGFDEIENSFSINNTLTLINILKQKCKQLIVSTHASYVLKEFDSSEAIPLTNGKLTTLSMLLPALGASGDEILILVEGVTDVAWVKSALSLLGIINDYLVIQCNGCDNVHNMFESLTGFGKKCLCIKDGDIRRKSEIIYPEDHLLSKDIIEMYLPLEKYNELIDQEASEIPSIKEDFIKKCEARGLNFRNFKKAISKHVSDFLDINNVLVTEIRNILKESINK